MGVCGRSPAAHGRHLKFKTPHPCNACMEPFRVVTVTSCRKDTNAPEDRRPRGGGSATLPGGPHPTAPPALLPAWKTGYVPKGMGGRSGAAGRARPGE